jgi:predicted nucleic acid-binding protein
VSVFVLDASYALTWCFLDRATENTDATLKRMEAAADSAVVPWVWQLEVANALGKGVVRRKLTAARAQEIWEELTLLPIRHVATPIDVPNLLELAVRHNISVYDSCYLQEARSASLPLATNDIGLGQAAESYGIEVIIP